MLGVPIQSPFWAPKAQTGKISSGQRDNGTVSRTEWTGLPSYLPGSRAHNGRGSQFRRLEMKIRLILFPERASPSRLHPWTSSSFTVGHEGSQHPEPFPCLRSNSGRVRRQLKVISGYSCHAPSEVPPSNRAFNMAALAHSLAHPRRFSKPLIIGPGVLDQNCCPVAHDGPWLRLELDFASWRPPTGSRCRAALLGLIARLAWTLTEPGYTR